MTIRCFHKTAPIKRLELEWDPAISPPLGIQIYGANCPSRQAAPKPAKPAARAEEPRKKGRRYTTGRNRQINIKATDAHH